MSKRVERAIKDWEVDKVKVLKILNLYCGIGGNRKDWDKFAKENNVKIEVTAVEYNESIADAYKQFFPGDKVIVGDAHQYLLENFQEFDFIWSSRPCQSHTRMRKTNSGIGERKSPHTFPDMKLYEEIIFLEHFFKGKWVVENVTPYYEPLIKPQKIGRHCFWSNFKIEPIEVKNTLNIRNGIKRDIGLDISEMKFTHRKDQIMSNCVEPKMGLHILNCSTKLNIEEEVKTCSTKHVIPPKSKDSGILPNFT